MPPKKECAITQRAYTLRLNRAEGSCSICEKTDCDCWRQVLWATHEAVNKGVRAFGNWLLTLRGGICHTLATAEAIPEEERRNRRILLALSWLSVEDARGAPEEWVVAKAKDQDRGIKVKNALFKILEKRQLPSDSIEQWVNDSAPSLQAMIREDAVWVNRSEAFDQKFGSESSEKLPRSEVWDLLGRVFDSPEKYFAGVADPASEDDDEERGAGEEKAKDLVQKAGEWLSNRFGKGKGADFNSMAKSYDSICQWAEKQSSPVTGNEALTCLAKFLNLPEPQRNLSGILDQISGPGYKSGTRNRLEAFNGKQQILQADLSNLKESSANDAKKCREKENRKETRTWSNVILTSVEKECGFCYHFPLANGKDKSRHQEFAVMLDHAARRVSLEHTWIKRAEGSRRKFDRNAKKLDELTNRAEAGVHWLDEFQKERSARSGAISDGGYRVRRGAIEGWTQIIRAWARPSCKTRDDRISAAREAQSDPEVKKFGDIQLFEALAADAAICVWRDERGNPDETILRDYVTGKTAESDRQRFKVPAYRHPDALRHPIFCDFGESRWEIEFDCHKPAKAGGNREKARPGHAGGSNNLHGLKMELWNGKTVESMTLRWSSKRLTSNLSLSGSPSPNAPAVTRADRLGRAAIVANASTAVRVRNVFEEKTWNGRLQAPRSQLNRIATLTENGNLRRADILRKKIKWLVSFSPRLAPAGPFIEYARAKNFEPNKSGEYYPNKLANEKRKGHAKLALARLPGLRVLSVDLGHRFAAACAVWEALSPEDFKKEIHENKIQAGGAGPTDMYLHIEKQGESGKQKTVIYRRIGADTLSGGELHPAPWARLDRQFLIKLQGEEGPARKAAPKEIQRVREWEDLLGRVYREKSHLPSPIDLLMAEAVKTLRQALYRHADRARIAYNLTARVKLNPGGGQTELNSADRIDLLTQTFLIWRNLMSDGNWKDPWAAEKWREIGLPAIQTKDEEENITDPNRKALRISLEESIRPPATDFATKDLSNLSNLWSQRWHADDAKWVQILSELKHWIAPRGLRALPTDATVTKIQKKSDLAALRGVGGLSIKRIQTITGLYQLLKAFKMRPHPNDLTLNIPGRGSNDLVNFNRRLLDVRNRLREQRVKQVSSRIVEAALGVGRVKAFPHGRNQERPGAPVDRACHAVVIESLSHYRPDELRTRRENRMLMQWASAQVKKGLKDSCFLHGLLLREVPANYTSRQCSRTGLPGLRCADISTNEFLTAPWWKRDVELAKRRLKAGGQQSVDRFLVDLTAHLNGLSSQGLQLPPTVRIPRPGGDLFVAAPPWSALRANRNITRIPGSNRAIQADLNAAANIGLRVLLDPDWPGRWWYVPCGGGTPDPISEKIEGSNAFDFLAEGKRLPIEEPGGEALHDDGKSRPRKKNGGAKKEIENLWRDISSDLSSMDPLTPWTRTSRYWNSVQHRIVLLLRGRVGLASD